MPIAPQGPALPQMPENAPRPLAPPFQPGDPVPWFRAPCDLHPDFDFSTFGGRYVVLSFLGSLSVQPVADIAAAFLQHDTQFDGVHAALALVTIDLRDAQSTITLGRPGIRLFFDFDRRVSRVFGLLPDEHSISFAPITYVLDRALRVVAALPVTDAHHHVRDVMGLIARLPRGVVFSAAMPQAPVLMIDNVFEPDFCDALVGAYKRHGGEESVHVTEKDGRTVAEIDHRVKKRFDWLIEDDRVVREIRARMLRRVVPDVLKAFQFDAARMERYLVACYDAREQGHFHAHRDNATRAQAHRRFSVSLNLNDDYDGGELVFPEYSGSLYRPPKGGAYVFSSSLLHEARMVTRGQRHAFLPFLYDDVAAKIREGNARFLAQSGAA